MSCTTHYSVCMLHCLLQAERIPCAWRPQAAWGLAPLVALLAAPAGSEAAESAAAAIGNLAAGGQALKDALREVGRAAAHMHAARCARACWTCACFPGCGAGSGGQANAAWPRASCEHWPRWLPSQRRRAA
jgi:hypothetical protein